MNNSDFSENDDLESDAIVGIFVPLILVTFWIIVGLYLGWKLNRNILKTLDMGPEMMEMLPENVPDVHVELPSSSMAYVEHHEKNPQLLLPPD